MLIDFTQLLYVVLLLIIGSIVLYIRRKAGGSKSVYKLTLILLGILLAVSTLNQKSLMQFDSLFLKNLSGLLFIILIFELSIRFNPDNIRFNEKNLTLFFSMLASNVVIIAIASILLLKIHPIYGIILGIIISSIEYFMIDELKEEGDIANPFLLLFAFSILYYFNQTHRTFENLINFLQYILIGLGTGVATGIIVFKSMRHQRINWLHEIGLISVALAVYIITDVIGGSGVFAVMILGVFFGNSYIKKSSAMKSFSPFIYKSLEILIFLMLGFVVFTNFNIDIILRSIAIFIIYLVIRFVIISLIHKRYSMHNKLLLSFAPKGMAFAAAILVLGSYGSVSDILILVMMMILIFSLICSTFFEYYENKKIAKLDRIFYVLKHMRFGRKRDLLRKRISLFKIFNFRKRRNK